MTDKEKILREIEVLTNLYNAMKTERDRDSAVSIIIETVNRLAYLVEQLKHF